MFFIGNICIAKSTLLIKVLKMRKKKFIAMFLQNKKGALPVKMAAGVVDKKYFKQQMNYIVLVQIGNHFIQFVMSFLVRLSTKATQPVLLF